ncbi:hypothetical protein FACS1894110_26090 [Spirochaetia bacterium]|nr:hypothetical protein FACS1894110_26090 [Spirochaetia bacterium]
MIASVQSKRPPAISDDLRAFLKDLGSGIPITMLVAPAARAVMPDLPCVLGFLRSLGVRTFFPVLPYADITVWVYYRLLTSNPAGPIISSACAGMNRYITRKHPNMAPEPMVYSPLLCAARYLKNYLGLDGAFAFLSPCSQKRFEFNVAGENMIRYNVTIAALSNWLSVNHPDLHKYPPADTGPAAEYADRDIVNFSQGLTVAAFGSISDVLACLLPNLDCTVTQGINDAERFFAETAAGRKRPAVFEPYACIGGCANGSGIRGMTRCTQSTPHTGNFLVQNKKAAREAILERFRHFDAALNMGDFYYA